MTTYYQQPLIQWRETQERLRMNKIYEGLRVKDDRPRYIFDGKSREYYRRFHPNKKTKAIFPPLGSIRTKDGILIPGLKTLYRPIMGGAPDTYYMRANGTAANKGAAGGPGSTQANCMNMSVHNGETFAAGDVIRLADDGGAYTSQLKPPSAGSSGNPITYDAESGDSPIINLRRIVAGSGTGGNWTDDGSDVWYITVSYNPFRIWLDSTEYLRAKASKSDIDSTTRWFWDDGTDRLYVYATENPASFYSNIEATEINSGGTYSVILSGGKHYITFDGLDIRGSQRSIYLDGVTNFILRNCNVGLDSYQGMFTYGINEYVTIYDSTYESGFNFDYTDYASPLPGPNDGIRLILDSNYWDVYDCNFRNWGHSCIGAGENADTISYNEFHDNELSAPNISYGRAFEFKGENAKNVGNKFYRNYCHDLTVRSQVGGNDNEVYYNIFYNITDSPCDLGGVEVGGGISLETVDDSDHVCDGNKIYNNLLMDIDSAGLRLEEYSNGDIENNLIRNNIFNNCGRASATLPNISLRVDDHADVNNNTFENNCFYKSGSSDIINYRGSNYSVANFELNLSNSDVASNNIQSDPLIVDAEGNDFTLRSTSPCKNAGTDVGLTQDYAGDVVPQGSAPDIGAYELPGGVSALTLTGAG